MIGKKPIYVFCEQGTREWIECRLGVATASCFSKILTPKGALSAQREDYMGKLLAEWVTGEPFDDWQGNEHTEWGKDNEPAARDYYCLENALEPGDFKQVGFVYSDESKLIGASPDCLITDVGLLEMKCPMPKNHLLTLFRGEIPKNHIPQLQGQLWVTQRLWVDFMSFHPLFPPFVERIYPDPVYQAAMDNALPQFAGEIEAAKERAVEEFGIDIAASREALNQGFESIDDLEYTDKQMKSDFSTLEPMGGWKKKPEGDDVKEALEGMDALSAQSREERK